MNTEERTEIYYKKSETFAREQQKLIKANITPRNKELILEYANILFAKGTQQYRVGKVVATLRRINELFLKKDLDKLTKADITTFAVAINTKASWSAHTKRDYNRAFKQFFNWWRHEDSRIDSQDPDARRDARKLFKYIDDTIKTGKPANTLTETDMITDEEYQELIENGCSSPMERAFIALIHERPLRIGEVLLLRIKNFHKKGRHALLDIPGGKTGVRQIPLLRSIAYIQEWIKNHPDKNNPDALLWLSTHNGHKGEPLRYIGARKLLQRVFFKAGITKKCNSHHFRHSRVTWDRRKYSDGIICAMAGFDAKQLKTYSHIGTITVEKAFLEQEGLVENKDKKQTSLFCGVCGESNPLENRYCYSCGNALDVTTCMEDEQKKNSAIDDALKEYADIMSDPVRAEKFMSFFKAFEKMKQNQ